SATTNMGSQTANVTLNGGTLQTTATFNFGHYLTPNGGTVSPDSGTTVTFNIAMISGTGPFFLNGAGAATMAAANSYTGGTVINNGTLNVSFDSGLGNAAGSVTLNGGTISSTGTWTTARNIALNGGTITVPSGIWTVNGVVSGGALTMLGAGGALVL